MEQLKEFMLVFRYEPSDVKPRQAQLDAIHQQWSDFISHIAMQGRLVSTHQLGPTGKQIHAGQQVTDGIHYSDRQMVSGNMLLKATDLEEALNYAQKCPILLAGGAVEVRDIIPPRL